MTIRDLLDIPSVSIDVCDDYDERCYIAYDSDMKLTEKGLERFADALDIPIIALRDLIVLHCETSKDAKACKELFEALAGYCTVSEYDKWFTER